MNEWESRTFWRSVRLLLEMIDLDVSRNSKFIFLVMMTGPVGSRKLGILINTAETDFKRDLKL